MDGPRTTATDDLRAMQDLAARVFPATGFRHIGDLAWSATLHDDAPTALWTRDGRTLAWARLEPPDGLQLQVDPAHPDLAQAVLAWAERTGSPPLTVEAAATEPVLTAALERRGYTRARTGPYLVCLGRPLAAPPVVPLPDGYTLRPAVTDIAGRAAAHRAAFASTRITTERHARMTETPPYRPELDLIAVSSDGEVAAYCQGWYDETNAVGEFEPVGTHPDHRRRGLARAVCTAVLHAFAAAGARRAVVYARGDTAYPVPRRLYESMGFTAYTRTHTYTGPR
ncbi:GNAT family N-acetyltransferase [Spirillospora sp. NPDC052242]